MLCLGVYVMVFIVITRPLISLHSKVLVKKRFSTSDMSEIWGQLRVLQAKSCKGSCVPLKAVSKLPKL